MPDAIKAINQLMSISKNQIKSRIYNITSFNPSPAEFFKAIKLYFKDSTLSYNVNSVRQNIVSSWPSDVNDSLAKNEWDWKPSYNLNDTIDKYLFPSINSNNEDKND